MMVNRILIIEDDRELGSVLADKFSRLGWAVVWVPSFEDLEQLLSIKDPFSHVLLDLNVGTSNSLAWIPRILNHSAQSKIVVLTGYASVHSGIEAVKLGAVYLLQKPSRMQEILAAFDHVPNPTAIGFDTHHRTGIAHIEDEIIQQALQENQFNITKTAAQLGLHRRTLQRRMKKRLG